MDVPTFRVDLTVGANGTAVDWPEDMPPEVRAQIEPALTAAIPKFERDRKAMMEQPVFEVNPKDDSVRLTHISAPRLMPDHSMYREQMGRARICEGPHAGRSLASVVREHIVETDVTFVASLMGSNEVPEGVAEQIRNALVRDAIGDSCICARCRKKAPTDIPLWDLLFCARCCQVAYCSEVCRVADHDRHVQRCCNPNGPLDEGPMGLGLVRDAVAAAAADNSDAADGSGGDLG